MMKYIHIKRVVFLFLAVAASLAIFVKYSEPVNDGDVWFHLAYGRYFLENRTLVPDHAVFSWMPADNDTIYCAWLSEAVLYLLYEAGGMNALLAFRFLAILAFMALAFSFLRRDWRKTLPIPLLICLVGLLMSYAGLRIKSELFSFLLMALLVWVWLWVKSRPDKALPIVYLLPVIFLVWVNSHGGFIFGLIFVGTMIAGELLNIMTGSSGKMDAQQMKHLLISAALCAPALLMTPYGWLYPAQLMNNLILNPGDAISHMKSIGEYQSIFLPEASFLHYKDYMVIALAALAALFLAHIRRRRIDWALLLVNACFLVLYMKFLRTTYYWGIVFVFSSLHLMRSLEKDQDPAPSAGPLRSAALFISGALLLFLSGSALYDTFCAPAMGFNPEYVSPVRESDYIRKHFSSLRIGNDYYCGSYLLWSLWPNQKVFIDARFFPYKKWYSEYCEFEDSTDKAFIEAFLNKYPCDLWCVSYSSRVLTFFTSSPNWKLVYYGPSACIFLSSRVSFSERAHDASESINESGIFQAYTVAKFAATVDDIDAAMNIAEAMKPNPLSTLQKNLATRALYNVGNSLLAKKRYDDAIEVFEHALAMGTANPVSRYLPGNKQKDNLGLLHEGLGYALMEDNRLDDSIREFRLALSLKPDAGHAKRYLPLVTGKAKEIDEAIARLKDAQKNRPNDLSVLHALAVHHAMKGRYGDALQYLMKELELSPDNPGIHYNIACMYSRQKDVQTAISHLDLALKKGFSDWNTIKDDHDLNAIRQTPYFQKLIGSH